MWDNSCPFLETKPGEQGLLYCTAGVNFYAVGQARELCRLCPLFEGRWTPTCEFMEVYTFLHVEKGQRWIEVRLDCWSLEDEAAECVRQDEVTRGDIVQPVQAVARHPLREGLLC
ncbi:MAG: hypothetical protein DRI77_10640 [Chloroflexi bacterium]|nr:MAG: hypothetical protein DRI77_10640 [Chloroflexota bacterium]